MKSLKTFTINDFLCEIKYLLCFIIMILPFVLLGYIEGKSFMTLMVVIVIAIIVFIFLSLIWKLISNGKKIINIKDNTITIIQSNRLSTYFNENESDTYTLEKVRIKYIHLPCLEQIYIGKTHPLIINKCALSREKYHELKEILENRCGKENINTKYTRKDFVTIMSIILLVFIIVKVFY